MLFSCNWTLACSWICILKKKLLNIVEPDVVWNSENPMTTDSERYKLKVMRLPLDVTTTPTLHGAPPLKSQWHKKKMEKITYKKTVTVLGLNEGITKKFMVSHKRRSVIEFYYSLTAPNIVVEKLRHSSKKIIVQARCSKLLFVAVYQIELAAL